MTSSTRKNVKSGGRNHGNKGKGKCIALEKNKSFSNHGKAISLNSNRSRAKADDDSGMPSRAIGGDGVSLLLLFNIHCQQFLYLIICLLTISCYGTYWFGILFPRSLVYNFFSFLQVLNHLNDYFTLLIISRETIWAQVGIKRYLANAHRSHIFMDRMIKLEALQLFSLSTIFF